MARIENLPRQRAKNPSRQRRFLGIASKGVGIAAALGAYLFSLLLNGVGAHFSVWDHELFAPIVPDASTLVFAAGLLLYVAGVLMRRDEVMK